MAFMYEATKQARQRLSEINGDLEITARMWQKNNDEDFRRAINKIRYILIVERHNLMGYEVY